MWSSGDFRYRSGIDPAAVENLFTPFYTTKNRGSGLGLAIVKNIIEGHNGSVAIESDPTAAPKWCSACPWTKAD